jgi:methanogenic corrinoid protein MtbC1
MDLMGGWQSSVLAGLGIAPAAVGADVLRLLELPRDDDFMELAELGVSTCDAALAHDRPSLLADYLAFAARRIEVLAERTPHRAALLALPGRLAPATVPPEAVGPLEAFLARSLAALRPGDLERLDPPMGLDDLARGYLDAVLDGRREQAVSLVLDAVRHGKDLAAVLVDVLEPAQKEIGRLWQEGEISVAQEHLCTSVTQQVMSELYPYLFTGVPRRHRLVAAQAPGSLHEVGLRMVVDLLEHEGWDTTYLGDGATPGEVVETLASRHAEVLAISASMPGQVRGVMALVSAVRTDPRTAEVKVVVGGRPFLVDPGLVAEVGADGSAADARQTVELCSRLVEADDVAV